MTTPTERAVPDPAVVRRQLDLFDHHAAWTAAHPGEDPDDDPEFVARAREIAGLPPLTEQRSLDDDSLRLRGIIQDHPRDFAVEYLARRAAGKDITPGHDQLHHYWTKGEGLAKWRGSPHPWTTLVALLTRHVGPAKAKVFASRWFHEVFGYYSGSDLHRVHSGKPPRGKRIGPG